MRSSRWRRRLAHRRDGHAAPARECLDRRGLPGAGRGGAARRLAAGAAAGHARRQSLPCRPNGDPPAALIALGAEVEIAAATGGGRSGRGALRRLHGDHSRAGRAAGRVRIPAPVTAPHYLKHRVRGIDTALVGAGVGVDPGGRWRDVRAPRIGLVGAGTTPLRASKRRGSLRRSPRLTPESARRRPPLAAEECEPLSDTEASEWYRREMVAVSYARAGTRAATRHGSVRMSPHEDEPQIGGRARRLDADDKVTGQARYATDYHLPGCSTARSSAVTGPHARIVSIDACAAEALPGVRRCSMASDPGVRFGEVVKDQTPSSRSTACAASANRSRRSRPIRPRPPNWRRS